ncbi:hypothetical protein WMY93_023719 [Mugilogobius chulae]|uniref:CortBP2/NAV1-like AAA+ ATPase lid domain-containing protein n=1 Tax=Mugilogobius chulae TaxID=88201 RepID=A0AAW0N6F8_9GOBI
MSANILTNTQHQLSSGASANILTNNTSSGPHWLIENGYIITTLSKPRLQGSELRLQQHLRWVSLRWDQEPESGLLLRSLRAGLWASARSHDDSLQRSALWVTRFWQRLNSCLCRLGTPEALIGPERFMSCPLSSAEDTVRFVCDLWNSAVVPRIEDAIVSRVCPRNSPVPSSADPCQAPGQTVGQTVQTVGQKALVKAALSIVLNRAVLQDCPLSRSDAAPTKTSTRNRDGAVPSRFLRQLVPSVGSESGPRPASRPGSGPGSKPGSMPARLWRRREHRLRRSNTSPRKRAVSGPASAEQEAPSGSFSVDLRRSLQLRRSAPQRWSRPVFRRRDGLIRELQTMCSSRSEPDISRISQTKEMFSNENPRQQQRNTTPPVSPSSRLPLPTTRAPHHHQTSRPKSTNTTSSPSSCADDNLHFVNNNHLSTPSRNSSGSSSSGDDV